MEINDHKLVGVEFNEARWFGDKIDPDLIVIHDTASSLDKGRAAAYLQDNDAKVSVHFVIDADGTITQQVPTNRRANHAGKSHYHGRDHVNGFSIGIELVNPGRLTRLNDTTARSWFKTSYNIEEYDIQEVTTKDHGHGLWMDYPEAQFNALLMLLEALTNAHEIADIVGHYYVSPGRKIDTNPLLNIEAIKAKVLGRDDIQHDLAMDESHEPKENLVQIEVPNSVLNMRRWPSINPNIIAQIPDGIVVPVLREGYFGTNKRHWKLVEYGGTEGWIVARYAAHLTQYSSPSLTKET